MRGEVPLKLRWREMDDWERIDIVEKCKEYTHTHTQGVSDGREDKVETMTRERLKAKMQ